MAFVTGLMLIDAPAAALNNSGDPIYNARTENTSAVKYIHTRAEGDYPYVSAQAFRAWLRGTLERRNPEWQTAPIYREKKVAYTDANPLKWWDDDLLGYMRAESKKLSAKEKEARAADETRAAATPTTTTITRLSPFRVSTLVSVAPVYLTTDFGVMARQEGDAVPFEHQFYRAVLQGLFSLNLHACGTFTYINKTGYLNLDDTRQELAKERDLEHIEQEKAYRLPLTERKKRVRALFDGLAHLEGGAKLTLHYTDVSPALIVMAVTKGGNNIFGHVISADSRWNMVFNCAALQEALGVFKDELLSDVYIGWVTGFADEQRAALVTALADETALQPFADIVHLMHPREAFAALTNDLETGDAWLA